MFSSKEAQDKFESEIGYHDMSVPYTAEEIEAVKKVIEASPTYKPCCGGTIASSEVPMVLQAMRMKANDDQVKAYQGYWDKHFKGRMYCEKMLNIMRNVHQNGTYLRALAENCDQDGNGFISEDELSSLLDMMRIKDPSLTEAGMSFENFVKQADANKDGKVSIEECKDWMEKSTN